MRLTDSLFVGYIIFSGKLLSVPYVVATVEAP